MNPDSNNCVQFANVRNPSLCIGIVNNRNAVLQSCNAYATAWLQQSNQGPHYVRWFAAPEYLTASRPGNGQPIFRTICTLAAGSSGAANDTANPAR
jgi:hypothetical protein